MKYKTFDLFDTIEEQKIKLSPAKGIHADAIAALTMERIGMHRTTSYKIPRYTFRKVAILILVLIALISTLLVTSATIQKYIKDPAGFWIISQGGQSSEQPSEPTEPKLTIEMTDPLGNILPEKFELVILEGESFDFLHAIYLTDDGKEVFFSATDSDGSTQIDAEGAEVSEIVQILDQEVVLVIEETDIRLAWIDQDVSASFALITIGLPKEDVIGFAEQIIQAVS